MTVFQELFHSWQDTQRDERFGQWFCNRYIEKSWPDLFYADYGIASTKIAKWLKDHQYEENMPPIVRDLNRIED